VADERRAGRATGDRGLGGGRLNRQSVGRFPTGSARYGAVVRAVRGVATGATSRPREIGIMRRTGDPLNAVGAITTIRP